MSVSLKSIGTSNNSSEFTPLRANSPEKARKVRRAAAIEFGDGHASAEVLLKQGFSNSRSIQIGRYSDERIKQKDLGLYAAPDEDVVESIIRVRANLFNLIFHDFLFFTEC